MLDNNQLVALWNDRKDLSAADLQRMMPGLTRSAILGRIHRARKRAEARGEAPVARRRVYQGFSHVRVRSMPDAARAVLALKDDQCRWPYGEPESPHFHFCDRTKKPGLSYCAYHAMRQYR